MVKIAFLIEKIQMKLDKQAQFNMELCLFLLF